MVAMETMHFFHSAKKFIFEDKTSGDLMNDLAHMKNCPGGGARKVQLASGVYVQIMNTLCSCVIFNSFLTLLTKNVC